MAYHRKSGIPVRIAMIFNTYGPRMRKQDGRAVPTFIQQALAGEPLTLHGDGRQTRSLCYVDDQIEGFHRLILSDQVGPVSIGNPRRVTIMELARMMRDLMKSEGSIVHDDRPVDDPEARCPDVSLARRALRRESAIPLEVGLRRTIEWAKASW
jgi:nucleoside-diphosphate-sugar epimerase